MILFRAMAGVLIIVGGLAAAQEPAQQVNRNRPRPRPLAHGDSLLPDTYPDPPAVPQNAPVVAPQRPPAQPSGVSPQAPPAGQTSAPAAQPAMPENLPPPSPPQVNYSNGLLTVQATNSTLGGLLQAIHNKTGIQFEGWEGSANERVAISMGPAPEGDVLAAILGGSKFDYVVLGRPDSPGTVQRVLLTPRRGGSAAAASVQPPRAGNVQAGGDDEDAPEEQASEEPEPQDTPVRPPLTQVQPQQPQQPQNQNTRTPEQLLEQLKQMQQQQQQQQQQQASPQNPPAPTKPPSIPQL